MLSTHNINYQMITQSQLRGNCLYLISIERMCMKFNYDHAQFFMGCQDPSSTINMAIPHQVIFINAIGLNIASMSINSVTFDVMHSNIGNLYIITETQKPSFSVNTSLFLHINPSYHTNIILLTSSVWIIEIQNISITRWILIAVDANHD